MMRLMAPQKPDVRIPIHSLNRVIKGHREVGTIKWICPKNQSRKLNSFPGFLVGIVDHPFTKKGVNQEDGCSLEEKLSSG